MSTRIICIANHKGGVGKTTTAVTLGHGLARRGKEVLIVDFDPQGQSATFLGINPSADIYFVLASRIAGEPRGPDLTALKQRVRSSGRKNLWIIPGGTETAIAQSTIVALAKPVSYIADVLKYFTGNGLHYIILDTSPSLGGLQERAVWASDYVLAPVQPDYAAAQGLRQLITTLTALRQEKGWGGTLVGVLPTLYDEQTRETRAEMKDVTRAFGNLLLPPIHRATILRECAAEGLTIYEKDPGSRAAREYEAVVDLVCSLA